MQPGNVIIIQGITVNTGAGRIIRVIRPWGIDIPELNFISTINRQIDCTAIIGQGAIDNSRIFNRRPADIIKKYINCVRLILHIKTARRNKQLTITDRQSINRIHRCRHGILKRPVKLSFFRNPAHGNPCFIFPPAGIQDHGRRLKNNKMIIQCGITAQPGDFRTLRIAASPVSAVNF